jgi:hypothetical protein
MSSQASGSSAGDAVPDSDARVALRVLLAVNLTLGVFFFLFLLALPSSPASAVIGRYSKDRLILLSGISAATVALVIASVGLSLKPRWRTSLAGYLYGRGGRVRRHLPVVGLLLMSVYLIPLLILPAQLEGLTTYHYTRLAPYLLWPWALLGSLALTPWIVRTRPRLRVHPSAAEAIAVASLILISFAARAPLSGYGLPYQAVWDETVTYPRALELLSGRTILQSGAVPGYGRASYGDPLTYITAFGQAAGFFANMRTGRVTSMSSYSSPPDGVGTVFEAVHESGVPLQYPRLLFALIGSLCPMMIYLALRRHFGGSVWVSLAGGLILAVLNPQVVYYSSFIWPDALATTLATAAILAGLEVIRAQGVGWIAELVCGGLVGMTVSVSARYVGLIPIPFLAVALSRSRQRWAARLGLVAAGLTLGFLATSPTLLTDLPGYIGRLAGFDWIGDDSLPNRMISLGFYVRGAFLGQGFGLILLGLVLVGYLEALQRHRFPSLFLTMVVLLHLVVITPTLYRYDRHALVLYPLAAIFAAVGLGFTKERLSAFLISLQRRMPSGWPLAGVSAAAWDRVILLLVFALCIPKTLQMVRFVDAMRAFQPSQVQMADYVSANLEPGTKIGLLEVIPFTDAHLRWSRADVHRVGLSTTLEELRQGGYEYVIGTDVIGSEFGESQDTIWVSDLLSEDESLIELGEDGLISRGYPVANLALYLSRVPPAEPTRNPAAAP